MKAIAGLFSFLLTLSLVVGAEAGPELGKYARVYKGDKLTVTMVRLGSKEKNTALIKFEGMDHDWDGKIMLHKVSERKTKNEFSTKELPSNKGKSWVSLWGKESWWGGKSYWVTLPGTGNDIPVYYDASASKTVKPRHFYTAYEKQKKQRKTASKK